MDYFLIAPIILSMPELLSRKAINVLEDRDLLTSWALLHNYASRSHYQGTKCKKLPMHALCHQVAVPCYLGRLHRKQYPISVPR